MVVDLNFMGGNKSMLQYFILYVIFILFIAFLRYFNDSLESVQVYHNRLLDYDWKPEQLYIKYCCAASVLRVCQNPNVTYITGYDYNYNQTITGISFTKASEIYFVFISTSNLDDTLCNLETSPTELNEGMIHSGYNNRFNRGIYTSIMTILHNTKSTIKITKINFIGHSLGGVMASIAGFYINRDFNFDVNVFTYGSPKWGNLQLKRIIESKKNLSITNWINISDPVVYRPKRIYTRIGKVISRNIDTGNDNVNHGLKIYREIVSNNLQKTYKHRPHRFDEIISRKIMDMFC